MGSRDSDSSLSGDEHVNSVHSGVSSISDKNSKKSDLPSTEDSVNNEPKSNNSCGSSEEGNSSGSGSSSGYANGVSSSHSSESTTFSGGTTTSEPIRSKYPSKKKDSQGYRQYHSEIEKKRRNKINSMIDELADLVPMCRGVSHKLDKLTVLKMTVQHMKMLTQKTAAEGICSPFKPPCIGEEEMKYLLEQAGDGFLFVLSSDRAQILYISDAVWEIMHYSPSDLIGRSLYDIVHSRDIPVIKDQLTPFASLPSINSARAARVGKPGPSRPEVGCMSGSRRSFFCRFRTLWKQGQDATDPCSFTLMNKPKNKLGMQYGTDAKSYTVVHCTGFLKSWQTADTPVFGVDDDVGLSTFCCFIAVGRKVETFSAKKGLKIGTSPHLRALPTQYTSHHSADAKILHVDSRVVSISGFLPQDLVGQSEYDYIHQDDIPTLADTFKKVLIRKDRGRVISNIYRLRAKSGFMIPMRTIAFSLFNPFSKELEYIVHENCMVPNMQPYNCNQAPEKLGIAPATQRGVDEVRDNGAGSQRYRSGIKRPGVPYVTLLPSSVNEIPSMAVLPSKRKTSLKSVVSIDIDTDVSTSTQLNCDDSRRKSILLSPVTASLVRRGAISIDFAAVAQALAGTEDEGKVISLTKFSTAKETTSPDTMADYYISPIVDAEDPQDGLDPQLPSVAESDDRVGVDSDPILTSYEKSQFSPSQPGLQDSPYVTPRQQIELEARDYYSQLLHLLPMHEELLLGSCERDNSGSANSSSGIDSGQNSENGSDHGLEKNPSKSSEGSSKSRPSAGGKSSRQRQRTHVLSTTRTFDNNKWQNGQAGDLESKTSPVEQLRDATLKNNSKHGSGYSSKGSTPSGYLSSDSSDVQMRNIQNRKEAGEELINRGKPNSWKDQDNFVNMSALHIARGGNGYLSNGHGEMSEGQREFQSLSASSLTSMVRESFEEHSVRTSVDSYSYNEIAAMLRMPKAAASQRD